MVDFESVFRHSPNPYMIVGTDLRFLAANEAYASAVSLAVDALVGRSLFDVFPGDVDAHGRPQADPVRMSIERVIASGRPDALALVPFAIERDTPRGRVFEERYWSATHTPLFDGDGRLYGVLQHTTDVTEVERDRAELAERRRQGGPTTEQLAQGVFSRARFVQDANTALEAQRRNLQALFAQAPGFMAVLRGADYRYEIANAAYDELIGRTTPIGARLVDVLPEIVGQGYINLLDQVRETGRRFVGRGMQVNLQHDAGDPRYVDFIYQPILDEHGRVDAIFVQGAEVTDREAALAALRDADRRKDRFLAILAHELRNPLAPIATAATLLRMAPDDPQRVREAGEIIDRQARHMTHLVSDLLDVSRVTQGQAVLDVRPMDLVAAVRAAIEQATPAIDRKAHVLRVRLPDAPVRMQGDHARITQVFANLLANAAKYTPREGHIDLAIDLDDDLACIEIADDGIGIDADLLPRVFDLFTQAEPTPDREEGGLGIGLALVRSLVQLHGGTIHASSDGPGRGARFRVCLPCDVRVPA